MPPKTPAQQVAELEARLGPDVSRFVGWATRDLWSRARVTALDLGFTLAEAEQIAATTVHGAVTSMSSAVKQARRDRQFPSRH